MKSTQFCYWLQGSFELNETKEFDCYQTQAIKDHLDLVFQHDPKPNGFCEFLRGYFKMSNPETINSSNTELIRLELREIFRKEIDPSYPEHNELSRIHNEDTKPHVEVMC